MKLINLVFVVVLFPLMAAAQYTENDWEERDTWMDVESIFMQAGIVKGSFVGDIGCHEGYLSIHLANKVGDTGRVFAVDVRSDRLETLKANLEERKLDNVEVIHGEYDNPKLPKVTLDVVVIMDTYHEMDDYMTILRRVKKALKPGGRIVIIEKSKNWVNNDSRAAQVTSHSMTPKYVRKELLRAGFKNLILKSNMGFWEKDENKTYWMLVARKE